MNTDFWNERWREGKIGFHEGRPNDLLVRHVARLGTNRRVLVPLCGKAEDIAYLASLGHHVVGVELVEHAVEAFFDEHAMTPVIYRTSSHALYSHDKITIVAGDFFTVTRELLGEVDALYDRAALVAMPPDARPRYAAHVRSLLAPRSPAVVLNYVHDAADGPPFSVPDDEVRELYGGGELLEERPDPRGRPGVERCWAITIE
jgi:thiopurine S-methyltransferase